MECGRCTEQCPANYTGKPLDPRKIIHHIKDSLLDAVAHPDAANRKTLIGDDQAQGLFIEMNFGVVRPVVLV